MSYRKNAILILLTMIVLVFFNSVYALPFNINTKSGTKLPTTVMSGRNATAYYTVQNNTSAQANSNLVKSLPPGVTQIISGGTYSDTCGASFNLAAHGNAGDSCTLQLSISGAVSPSTTPPIMVCMAGGLICAGTFDRLNVRVATPSLVTLAITPTTTTLYPNETQSYTAVGTYSDNFTSDITTQVQWSSANPSVATIASNGVSTALSVGSTTISATANGISNQATMNVVNTPTVTTSIAPTIVNINSTFGINFSQSGYGSNVLSATLANGMTFVGATQCTVTQSAPHCRLTVNAGSNAGIATIVPTLLSGNATVVSVPNPLQITVTQAAYAYISDFSSTIAKCLVDPATGQFIGNCNAMNTQGTQFSNTSGTSFATFNNVNYVYVSDASNTLWKCPLNGNGDASSACTGLSNTTGSGFLSTANSTFYTFSGTTYAYVSDNSSTLWQCPVDSSTGSFSGGCNALTVNNVSTSNIFNTTFYTFSGTTYAYVADHFFGIWLCPMTSTGTINGSCSALINSPPFIASLGISFNTFNGTTYAFIMDDSSNVWQCPIDTTNGTFSNLCSALTNTTLPFFLSTGITFKNFSGDTYAYISDQTNMLWQCPVNASSGAFGNNCHALGQISNLNDNVLGATFYTP